MQTRSKSKAAVAGTKKRRPTAREPKPVVILRDIPPGLDWGWFSREDQRMHLQTVDSKHLNQYKVWLERDGKRVFEPAGPIPARILKRLQKEVERLRRHIDGRWAGFMIRRDWIQLRVHLPEVTLTCYPTTSGKFTRKVNLQEWFSPQAYSRITPQDVFFTEEMGALSVFKDVPEDRRDDFDLTRILWQD